MVYFNKIASDYHLKRKRPWLALSDFLKHISILGISLIGTIMDLGCGNGRNFELFMSSKTKLIGVDISIEFLNLARQRIRENEITNKTECLNINLILADMQNLPLRRNSINICVSVASVHHIKTFNNRFKVISQLKKSLKPNGTLILTVWRRWQRKYKIVFIKDKFKRIWFKKYMKNKGLIEFGDIIIPWILPKENRKIDRFYHLFSKKELLKLLSGFNIECLLKKGGTTNKDNFFVLAKLGSSTIT